jgi:hypothetical protein
VRLADEQKVERKYRERKRVQKNQRKKELLNNLCELLML